MATCLVRRGPLWSRALQLTRSKAGGIAARSSSCFSTAAQVLPATPVRSASAKQAASLPRLHSVVFGSSRCVSRASSAASCLFKRFRCTRSASWGSIWRHRIHRASQLRSPVPLRVTPPPTHSAPLPFCWAFDWRPLTPLLKRSLIHMGSSQSYPGILWQCRCVYPSVASRSRMHHSFRSLVREAPPPPLPLPRKPFPLYPIAHIPRVTAFVLFGTLFSISRS